MVPTRWTRQGAAFTTDEIIDRLNILWRKLEDEGSYVSANTVKLALERLEELSHAELDRAAGVK